MNGVKQVLGEGIRLGVVADDLTGANATGVSLAALGLEVWSALTAGDQPRLAGHGQAVMRITESRAIPAAEAARRVTQATEQLVAAGANVFGKRIDSTVRGNLGAELEAMMTALDRAGRPHLALVVPAYPTSGRVVSGGYLLVYGVPVEETAAGRDPGAPVRCSHVGAVLREQTDLPAELLGLDRVLQGVDAIGAALEAAVRKGIRVVVADATTDEHLERLAQAAARLENPVLSVDPGPFTAAIARARLARAGQAVPDRSCAGSRGAPSGSEPGRSGRAYLAGAVGSVTPLSLQQVEQAKAAGAVQVIPLPVDDLVARGGGWCPEEAASVPAVAGEALQTALACLRRGEVPLFVTRTSGQPLLPPEAAGSVAGAVGCLLSLLAEEAAEQRTPLAGLYLSGGDITVAACRALGSTLLRLESEVAPLVAFARLEGGPHRELALVTKGGLVGDEQALIRCVQYLAEHAGSVRRPEPDAAASGSAGGGHRPPGGLETGVRQGSRGTPVGGSPEGVSTFVDARMERPLLAVTAGDPAGIGPEITLAALKEAEVYQRCRPLVLAEPAVLERVQPLVAPELELHVVRSLSEARFEPGRVDVLSVQAIEAGRLEQEVPFGRVSRLAGELAFAWIRRSIELALAGEVDGVVTGPINKEAIRAAGIPFIGHTEMFQELTGSATSLTMFRTGPLKIFFLTRHVPLRDACDQVRKERILKTLRDVAHHLAVLGIDDPEIGVAALNPHAGEGGLLGEEERREIIPAIEAAQAEGIRAVGPVPADSIFVFAARGAYDAVLSLYHDQGHIASKVLDFEGTISVTLGLPFIRTSVDHGTAFDIAGQGGAQARSMVEAIRAGAEYAPRIRAAQGAPPYRD